MNYALETSHLSVDRRGVPVLGDLSLTVDSGELVAVLGPSGAGKTTLLRAICGLQRCRGTVLIDGRDVSELPPHRRNCAIMLDDDGLFSHLTVRDNIAYAVHASRGDVTVSDQVEAALLTVNIDHLAGRLPHQMSMGERQRVALARILVRRPRVLLFDEPLAHVDATARACLCQELVRVHRRMDCATIYVTHDVGEALSIADRVVYLADGQIVQDDYPEDVHATPARLDIARHMGATTMISCTARITGQPPMAEARIFDDVVRVAAHPRFDDLVGTEQQMVLVGYPGSIRISRSSEQIRVHGRHGQVVSHVFDGEFYLVGVETEYGMVTARIGVDAEPMMVGDAVTVSAVASRLWALPVG